MLDWSVRLALGTGAWARREREALRVGAARGNSCWLLRSLMWR
jgi:hypothetical protein